MKKSVFARALIAGVLLLSLPTAAHAAEDDGYTPGVDGSLTLVGSEVVGVCDNDVPWIDYSVVLTDTENKSTSHSARLVLSNGSQSTTLQLGELGSDGTLSGRILWPGASVASDGTPTGWPGWAYVDGAWVETNDNFAWTRGDISATVIVNPEVSVALSYPPSNPYCSTRPNITGEPAGVDGEVLAVTGGSFDALPFVVGGGVVLLAGAGLFAFSRRRRTN